MRRHNTGLRTALSTALCAATTLLAQACCYMPGAAPPGSPALDPFTAQGSGPGSASPVAPPVRPPSPGATGHLDEASLVAYASSRAPQAPDPRSLYDTSVAHDGEAPIERGMLVCRAIVRGGGYDDPLFAGGADVALRVRIGSGEIRRTRDTSLRLYTFPVARLTRGDTFWVRVVDRDVIFDDTIAEGTGTYASAPFVLTMGQADVECRAAPQAAVDRNAQSTIAALGRAAEQLGSPTPDLSAADAGYPRVRVDAALRALDAALAWVEFSDAALQAQVRRLEAFEDAWGVRLVDALGEAMRTLPPSGEAQELPGAGQVRVSALDCGRSADALRSALPPASSRNDYGCITTLELTAARALTLEPAGLGHVFESWGVMGDGSRADAHVIARQVEAGASPPMTEPMPIAEGTTVTLHFEYASASAPSLLRLRRGSTALLLRVE